MNDHKRFFIVGAAKSGTTALYHALKKHPEIFLPQIKEPHFFSKTYNIPSAEKINPDKVYHTLKVETWEVYNSLYQKSTSHQALGDICPSYLYDPNAARKISEAFPDAKIIMILRDPIQRAFSHYLMDVAGGNQRLDFYEAILKDKEKPKKGWGISHLYIELGEYSKQLSRYYKYFDKEQLKVFIYEEFESNPNDVLAELLDFLEVSSMEFGEVEKRNSYKKPTNRVVYELMSLRNRVPLLNSLMPHKLKFFAKKIFYKKSEKPQISDIARQFLLEIYRDEVEKISDLTSLDKSRFQRNWFNG